MVSKSFFKRLFIREKPNFKPKQKRKRLGAKLAVVITSSILISSCGTDPAIRQAQEFAQLKDRFENNTNRLAEEFYKSCIRRLGYFAVREGTMAREQALESCETRNKPTVQEVNNANKIVVNYIESIGNLAADDLVNFDDEFDRIRNSLNSIAIPTNNGVVTLPSGAVNTGTQIANFIFRWVTNENRTGVLREAIVCTDAPFQSYSDGLKFIYERGYINGVLLDEQTEARSYYNFYITRLRSTGTDRDFMELERESSQAEQFFVTQRNLANDYIRIIDITAEAHGQLKNVFANSSDAPSEESCAVYLNARESDNTTSVDSGEKPLDQPLSLEELTQVREIASDYQRKIKPILERMEKKLND
ncbi:MAG: hypothetical protein AB4060_20155 [Crocosphaera sp.]